MSHEQANRLCRFAWGELPFAELQLYSMRHVQEHAGQLHMFLGQQAGKIDTRPSFRPESGWLDVISMNGENSGTK